MISNVASVRPTYSDVLCRNTLLAFSSAPSIPLLQSALVHLFIAGPSPIQQFNVLADFAAAVFAGYAPIATGPLLGPSTASDGNGDVIFQDFSWVCTAAPLTGVSVLGYYVVDSTGLILLASEYFPAPAPIVLLGDAINLKMILPMKATEPV